MKKFLEMISEEDQNVDNQGEKERLEVIRQKDTPSKTLVGFLKSKDEKVVQAAREELERRKQAGEDVAGYESDDPMTDEDGQPIPDETSVNTGEELPLNADSIANELNVKVHPDEENDDKKKSLKSKPNEIIINPEYNARIGISEEKERSVVFSFGRMNPITVGHEKLVDKVRKTARSKNADARVYLSSSQDKKKNPIPYKDKLKFAKKAFPNVIQDMPSEARTYGMLIGILKNLDKSYDHITMVVGSDRIATMQNLLKKYNGKEFEFKTIQVVSAGERDPDSDDVSGISASKMRELVKQGDLESFRKGLPLRLRRDAQSIFNIIDKNLKEEVELDEVSMGSRYMTVRDNMHDAQMKSAKAYQSGNRALGDAHKSEALRLKKKLSSMNRNEEVEEETLEERVLTVQQRLKRRAAMKRAKGRVRVGQRKALRTKASGKKIDTRSKRLAIRLMRKRILRGKKYNQLSYSARQAVDRIVARRAAVIKRIARKLSPKVRRAESQRKSGSGFRSVTRKEEFSKYNDQFGQFMNEENFMDFVHTVLEDFGQEIDINLSESEENYLRKRAEESGESYEVLRRVYDRGIVNWQMGLNEDVTPQQWAFARVNSFISEGKSRKTVDADLSEADVFGIGKAISPVIHMHSYKAAKKVLQQVWDRKKEEAKKKYPNKKGPRHSLEWYASEIAKQYHGVDARKLAKMIREEEEMISFKQYTKLQEKKVPEPTGDLKDACWKGYTAVGTKMKNGKKVPNCVPVKEESEEVSEAKGSKYQLYHNTYSSAINHALAHHEKSGLKVHDDDRWDKVAVGSKKPSSGKTTRVNIPATHTKTGKKHMIHVQVYNKGGSTPYELNTYSSTHRSLQKESVNNQSSYESGAGFEGTDELVKNYKKDTPGQQIDELSKDTLRSYAGKAMADSSKKSTLSMKAYMDAKDIRKKSGGSSNVADRLDKSSAELDKKAKKRLAGAQKALGKLSEEDEVSKTREQIKKEKELDKQKFDRMMDRARTVAAARKNQVTEEEKPLNKPIRTSGEKKKFKVYVKDKSTGNTKTVRFGDSNMEIKRDDPERRKSFRARHNCDSAKDKTTPRYWSCRQWRAGSKVED